MGEIADAMIDGELCQGCGVYLGNGVGYPRYCSSCQSDEKKPEQWSFRVHRDKNKNAAYHICKCTLWQMKKTDSFKGAVNILRQYALHREWEHTNAGSIAYRIRQEQDGWKLFKTWVKELPDVDKTV